MNTTETLPTTLALDQPAPGLLGMAERGWLPDPMLRFGMRRLCAQRLRDEQQGGIDAQAERTQSRIAELRQSPLAIHTEEANRQHYELPPGFFQHCLGRRLKYSSAYYAHGDETLDQAEEAMLALYGERARLHDGQDILELGCGWGSLTLWMAERFPNSRITAVSNSRPQREHIEAQCRQRNLRNVKIITTDVNRLDIGTERFDRCVSIEMFEHMRNYRTLLQRIATGLRSDGQLFVHIFAHRDLLYPFETQGDDNWMGRHFFTGGLMPAVDTLLWFQEALSLDARWLVDGRHYQRTANHWLQNQDKHRDAVMTILEQAYGRALAPLWNQRWRMFWMACAELFGFENGQQWLVAHYRFDKKT